MADAAELVARLRVLVSRFDRLGMLPRDVLSRNIEPVRDAANEVLIDAYHAGVLRSIEGIEVIGDSIKSANFLENLLIESRLFARVIGFNYSQVEIEDSGNDEYRKRVYSILPGLIWQCPIYFEFETDDPLSTYGFDICDRYARGCEMLIDIIEREMASQKQVDADDGDGLFENDRILVWGGVRFTLRTNQAIVFRLLVDAYPGDVTHGTFEDKGIRTLRDSFRFKNAGGKNEYYPCWGVITDGSVKDSKRLIDPSIVRRDPEKFSHPQHNPQESPR